LHISNLLVNFAISIIQYMCTTISSDRKFIFDNRTRECSWCDDGKQYIFTETCKTCDGKKRFLKGNRRYKCKTCSGTGYTMLDQRIEDGACRHCEGTRKLPLGAYDNMTEEDKHWVFVNLFNFDKPYTKPTSSFNEGYLGFGIVCGVTDYGRYKKLTPEEFKEEVRESFMNGWLQYITLTGKEGYLPTEILIRKGDSGWFAYPIKQENQ